MINRLKLFSKNTYKSTSILLSSSSSTITSFQTLNRYFSCGSGGEKSLESEKSLKNLSQRIMPGGSYDDSSFLPPDHNSLTHSKYPLQASLPSDAPPIQGINRVSHRISNIITNLTDGTHSRILHIYPDDPPVAAFINKSSNLEMQGFSSKTSQFKNILSKEKYIEIKSADTITSTMDLPFRSQEFSFLIMSLPSYHCERPPENFSKTLSSIENKGLENLNLLTLPPISLESLSKYVCIDGYVILAIPSIIYEEFYSSSIQQGSSFFNWEVQVEHIMEVPLKEIGDIFPYDNNGEIEAEDVGDLTMYTTPVVPFPIVQIDPVTMRVKTMGDPLPAVAYTLAVLKKKID